MSNALKRKTSPSAEDVFADSSTKRRFVEAEVDDQAPDADGDVVGAEQEAEAAENAEEPADAGSAPTQSNSSGRPSRAERLKALRERSSQSRKQNLKESRAEANRLATDQNQLNALQRKHAIASHKLLKADTTAAGEDFERKRAWDWTIEESEKWDRRMAKKEKHRENVAFQDFRGEANKVYKRQMKQISHNLEAYQKEKSEAIERAAQNGGLEIVETEDGELIAVDKDGSFYSTADSTEFINNKPSKENVDRLIGEIKKAEEARLKKRRERGQGDDNGDVTYINLKNKQFNEKLARFYDKYTADIRESFERGTAI